MYIPCVCKVNLYLHIGVRYSGDFEVRTNIPFDDGKSAFFHVINGSTLPSVCYTVIYMVRVGLGLG